MVKGARKVIRTKKKKKKNRIGTIAQPLLSCLSLFKENVKIFKLCCFFFFSRD